jgi:hypothetical protein
VELIKKIFSDSLTGPEFPYLPVLGVLKEIQGVKNDF